MNVNIMQWNVWYKANAADVLRVIQDQNADILCLQEVTTRSRYNPGVDVPAAIAALGYEHRFAVTIEREGEDYKQEGCGIFSKFPIRSHRQVVIQHADPTAQPVPQYDRVYLEVVTDTPTGPLTVGTTHLSYSPKFEMSDARLLEGDRLLEAIGSIGSRFILTGDFNALPDSALVQKLLTRFSNAGPDLNVPTWTTKPFSYHGHIAEGLHWRLGYILTTDDVTLQEARAGSTDVSDHLPIISTLAV